MHVSQAVEDKYGVEPVGKLMKEILSHGRIHTERPVVGCEFLSTKNHQDIRWNHSHLQKAWQKSLFMTYLYLSGMNMGSSSCVMSAGLKHLAII